MEGEFLNAVETLAANLKTRLLREAVKEWEPTIPNSPSPLPIPAAHKLGSLYGISFEYSG